MYNSSCDSYIASTLNQSSFDHWPLAYPTQEVPNPYIPVPNTLEELRAQQNKVWTPIPSAVHTLEYKKGGTGSYRNNRPATRSRANTGHKKPTQVKKLRKSENQIEVLKNYFKANSKPGRENVAQLAAATGLKFLEVRNWFRNARLRNKEGSMNQQGMGTKSEEDSCGEVSSSTGSNLPINKSQEISMLWERLDNEERKNLLPKYLTTWEKDSPERTEVIRALLKTLSTTERNFVHGAVKPRGPYRCSSDKNLSKTTILERAKNAWKELERMFGANKQKSPVEGFQDNLSLNLDRDMLEGLKSLFQAHRDYLFYLVKEMGIDTSDEKDMGKLKTANSLQRYTEDDMFIPHPQYGSVSPGTMEMLQPYTQNVSALSNSYPPSVYPIMPATPTPIYPTTDFMSYPYTNSQHSYPQTSPLQLGGSTTSASARSAWVPTLTPTEDRSPILTKSYYPDTGPDYSFVKNHFSPEKLSAHHQQPEKPIIKPFSEVGGMSFNYNTAGPNTEITQKCTFVKYYEVTYNNKTCPTTGTQVTAGPKSLPLQPLQSLTAPPSSKFEQLL
ncbi:uncharacterized protein LOC134812626 isoform X2 [Bolinopsis microptera]|uniref:uncharacterized protein LOC134812626 isoform X2 n=1 Tax=Bolinopsis microptera TaxID=2820187 RepID=UPI00307A3C78